MNVVIIVETIQYIEFTYRTNKEVLHDAHFLMVRVLHIAYVKFLDIILLKVDNVFWIQTWTWYVFLTTTIKFHDIDIEWYKHVFAAC